MKPSSYQYYRQQKNKINPDEERLKIKIKHLFDESRQSAGSRTLHHTLQNSGEKIGRFKVRRLMREMGLESKQLGKHRYKPAVKPSDIADNLLSLNRIKYGVEM